MLTMNVGITLSQPVKVIEHLPYSMHASAIMTA
jgi:hypothetical protein